MELHEQVNLVKTKEDLARFVEALRADLISNVDDWENPDLERFLDAMSAWIRSMDNAYKNMGKSVPVRPDWSVFADILLAAKIYE
ncbi:DUF7660 family protein [Methylocaldum gracile]|jgi:nitrous oxide reductase accessory protein NosL|uniref:DUF7660 family protein n=1 Tax=Methylocaldum sp. 0917 TaxID=2485163 RepID=UPI00105D0311